MALASGLSTRMCVLVRAGLIGRTVYKRAGGGSNGSTPVKRSNFHALARIHAPAPTDTPARPASAGATKMADSSSLTAAAEKRISCYTLTNTSTISDARIKEIVEFAVKHGPSPFNVQSCRAVVLLKADHAKFWAIADSWLQEKMPEAAYQGLKPRVDGFKAAYGSVLWFEDQDTLEALKKTHPGVAHCVPQWSQHSSGMNQFIAWTALELEGLGCNLQHYNFISEITEEVRKTWDLPASWDLQSQLVIGKPVDGLKRSRERTYLPLADRVKSFGGD